MKKELNSESKVRENALTGASAAVGATAGLMVGDAIANEVQAAEMPELVVEPEKPEIEVIQTEPEKPVTNVGQTQEEGPQTPITSNEEPEVEILGYETVSDGDGNLVDVAVMTVGGSAALVIDADRDGLADAMAVDLNNNNELDEGEIIRLEEENIAMEPFRQEAALMGNDSLLTENNEDYVNDADVTEYMA